MSEYHLHPLCLQALAHSSLDCSALRLLLLPSHAFGNVTSLATPSSTFAGSLPTSPTCFLNWIPALFRDHHFCSTLPGKFSSLLWAICHGTTRHCLRSPNSLLPLPDPLLPLLLAGHRGPAEHSSACNYRLRHAGSPLSPSSYLASSTYPVT